MAVVLIVGVLVVFWHPHGPAAHSTLADPVRTPGVLNPDVTQANIRSTICRHGWTATIRPPTEYTRAQDEADAAIRRDGLALRLPGGPLISLELGGNPTDPRNLWPEPYPRASDVDKIENELNSEVCSGQLTLAEAQLREDDLKHTQG